MRELIGHVSNDYVAFVTSAVIFLIFTLAYLYWSDRSKNQYTFPCVNATDPNLGNLKDMKDAGGVHDYLMSLHQKHGPLVGFWWSKELVVSLGSVAAWKDISGLFDRPVEQFIMFKTLIGQYSLQYANGVIGKKRRQLLDRSYAHSALKGIFGILHQVGAEIVVKLKNSGQGEHIPVRQYMMAVALKSILRTSFGDHFNSDKEIIKYQKAYDVCWTEMENQVDGDVFEKGSEREKNFFEALGLMKSEMNEIINKRRKMDEKPFTTLLDVLLEEPDYFRDQNMIFDNAITYLIGGFHTTGNLMTWAIYYIAMNNDVQEKMFREIRDVLASNELEMDTIPMFEYVRQVIDETMRVSILAPWGARFSEYDIVIDGHVVPKETPLITPFGVVLHDPEIFPDPEKFDPERFSEENKKKIPSLAFSPFGFAGKRKCPGYRFAYLESTVFLIMLVKNFKFAMVEGQVVKPQRNLVSQPENEIWVTVEPR